MNIKYDIKLMKKVSQEIKKQNMLSEATKMMKKDNLLSEASKVMRQQMNSLKIK